MASNGYQITSGSSQTPIYSDAKKWDCAKEDPEEDGSESEKNTGKFIKYFLKKYLTVAVK